MTKGSFPQKNVVCKFPLDQAGRRIPDHRNTRFAPYPSCHQATSEHDVEIESGLTPLGAPSQNSVDRRSPLLTNPPGEYNEVRTDAQADTKRKYQGSGLRCTRCNYLAIRQDEFEIHKGVCSNTFTLTHPITLTSSTLALSPLETPRLLDLPASSHPSTSAASSNIDAGPSKAKKRRESSVKPAEASSLRHLRAPRAATKRKAISGVLSGINYGGFCYRCKRSVRFFGQHMNTVHNPSVRVEFDDGCSTVVVRDVDGILKCPASGPESKCNYSCTYTPAMARHTRQDCPGHGPHAPLGPDYSQTRMMHHISSSPVGSPRFEVSHSTVNVSSSSVGISNGLLELQYPPLPAAESSAHHWVAPSADFPIATSFDEWSFWSSDINSLAGSLPYSFYPNLNDGGLSYSQWLGHTFSLPQVPNGSVPREEGRVATDTQRSSFSGDSGFAR